MNIDHFTTRQFAAEIFHYWEEDINILYCLLYIDAACNVGNVDMLIS